MEHIQSVVFSDGKDADGNPAEVVTIVATVNPKESKSGSSFLLVSAHGPVATSKGIMKLGANLYTPNK